MSEISEVKESAEQEESDDEEVRFQIYIVMQHPVIVKLLPQLSSALLSWYQTVFREVFHSSLM